MMHYPISILLILLTTAAIAASHVFWTHPWWRRPLLWTDRWHLLSWLSYWPICAWTLWQVAPLYPWNLRASMPWWGIAIASALIWGIIKRLGGKAWPMWWTQVFRWLRRS